MQKKIKEAKGITLVALVITIIILLILAGVALSLVIGENGLIAKSKESVEKYKDKAKAEKWQLEDIEAGMEKIDLAELKDEEEHPELKQMKLLLNITEDNKEIQLPAYQYTYENYTYDCSVQWGDGTTEQVTNENAKTTKHTYANTGTYTVTIEGTYESLYVDWQDESMQKALKKVEQWGATGLKEIYLGNCTNLKEIAEPSKNSLANVTRVGNAFAGCSNLTSIPERLFANCPNVTSFYYTFCECSSLTNIPERLFANCPNVTDFESTFLGCSNITRLPERLFVNCPNVTSFYATFAHCTELTGTSIHLWNEKRRQANGITENSGGEGCYYMCEKLEDYGRIPSYWKRTPSPG